MEDRLEQLVVAIAAELGATVIELEVMADRVDLLVEMPPALSLSRLVGMVKGRSSRVLGQEFPVLRRFPSLWTSSWFVSTVGGAPLGVVCGYVENQKSAA